jgi:hypothetical protein
VQFPPAWYPDPTARHDHRWWDGAEWTAHVADAGRVGRDPLDGPLRSGPARSTTDGAGSEPGPGWAAGRPGPGGFVLAAGVGALLVAPFPFLGLALAVGALVLGLRARRRSGPATGRGLATAGVVAAALGTATAVASTLLALTVMIDGSGGAVGAATRAYVACLDERPRQVCQRQLTVDLVEALGG